MASLGFDLHGLGFEVDVDTPVVLPALEFSKPVSIDERGELDYLKSNLEDVSLNLLKNDFDWLHVTVGAPGHGKSLFSFFDICKQVNPALFNTSKVCFDIPGFFHTVAAVDKPCTPIDLDEGGEILFSLDTMDRDAKKVVKFFMRARQKNMFICVNITDFEYLNRYVRNNRLMSMTKVKAYFNRNTRLLVRGFYEAWNRRQVKKIRQDGRGQLHWSHPNFHGRFADRSGTREWAAYRKAKDAFLSEKGEEYSKMRSYREENVLLRQRLFEAEKKKQLEAVVEDLPDLQENLDKSFDRLGIEVLPWEKDK